MNNKKKTLILITLFIVLMIGASVLYNSLSKNYQPDTLLTENDKSDSNPNNTAADEENSDTAENSEPATDSTVDADSTNTTDSSANTNSSSEQNEPLNTAPNFTVYDLDGNQVNLTDFFGKPIIVNFWASWCGPCKMEMPDFDEAYKTYNGEIQFLMVNMTDGARETKELASAFIAESGYSFPVYYDTDYSAAITYSVSSLPTSYFINEKGELVAHARGAIDATTLQRGIDMIYNQEP